MKGVQDFRGSKGSDVLWDAGRGLYSVGVSTVQPVRSPLTGLGSGPNYSVLVSDQVCGCPRRLEVCFPGRPGNRTLFPDTRGLGPGPEGTEARVVFPGRGVFRVPFPSRHCPVSVEGASWMSTTPSLRETPTSPLVVSGFGRESS